MENYTNLQRIVIFLILTYFFTPLAESWSANRRWLWSWSGRDPLRRTANFLATGWDTASRTMKIGWKCTRTATLSRTASSSSVSVKFNCVCARPSRSIYGATRIKTQGDLLVFFIFARVCTCTHVQCCVCFAALSSERASARRADYEKFSAGPGL